METEQLLAKLNDIQSTLDVLKDQITNKTTPKVKSGNVMERVKSYEDACEELSLNAIEILPYKDPKTKDEIYYNAHKKLVIIIRALNEGWMPDWSNKDEYKYWPYFEYKESSFGFSYAHCDSWGTDADVGSRLCLKTEKLARYTGENFIKIYNEYLTN